MAKPTTVIYAIVNTQTQRRYVGSTTTGLAQRKAMHVLALRRGVHHNSELQRDFNVYGPDAFTFEVLQDVGSTTKSYLCALEELHIALQGWQVDCYNAANPSGGQRLKPRPKHTKTARNYRVPVEELDEDGNVIARWDSLVACCKDQGLHRVMVSRVCRGERNHTQKRCFRYVSQ